MKKNKKDINIENRIDPELPRNEELEEKRKEYREWIVANPPPIDENSGLEMKECQGCYCQMSYKSGYDFCFDCLDCDGMPCGNSDPYLGGCCACYGKKMGDPKLEKKKLTFTQRQRLNWEQVKQNAEDKIEEIKDHEDPNYSMQTAKQIEDVQRWSRQEKDWATKDLTVEELKELLKSKEIDSPK